jgi:hypothetical protein
VKKTKPKLMDRKCSKGQQSLNMTAIWTMGSHRLRVQRKRDAYDFQSYAMIERWDGTKWHNVASIPFGMMAHGGQDIYVSRSTARPNPSELEDETELLRLAALVL